MNNKNKWPSLDNVHTIVFDFDGVFTDNKVYVNESSQEMVRCDRSDGLAINFLRSFRLQKKLYADFFILSKEQNAVVMARAQKLQLDCQHGVDNKVSFLENYLADKFPDKSQPFSGLIYLGNDINDLPAMCKAGFSVAPSDAHQLVKYVANVVLPQKGGEGFVRAFVEQFLGVNQLTIGETCELILNS